MGGREEWAEDVRGSEPIPGVEHHLGGAHLRVLWIKRSSRILYIVRAKPHQVDAAYRRAKIVAFVTSCSAAMERPQ